MINEPMIEPLGQLWPNDHWYDQWTNDWTIGSTVTQWSLVWSMNQSLKHWFNCDPIIIQHRSLNSKWLFYNLQVEKSCSGCRESAQNIRRPPVRVPRPKRSRPSSASTPTWATLGVVRASRNVVRGNCETPLPLQSTLKRRRRRRQMNVNFLWISCSVWIVRKNNLNNRNWPSLSSTW